MYLVIEIDSDIEVIVFSSVFEYVFNVRELDMWHLILYVNDEEWSDIEMPNDSELPEDVMWFCLCTDEEFDEAM